MITQAEVQDRIREAAIVIRRMSNPDHRFLKAGERGSWPGYVRDWQAYGADRVRLKLPPPNGAEIDRMEETIGWISWLATQDEREARIVWLMFGAGQRVNVIARTFGISRDTVERDRKAGVQRIVTRIRAIHKIAA